MFSSIHVSALFLLLLFNCLFIFILIKVRNNNPGKYVKPAIALFLVSNEVCYQIWNIAYGTWAIDYTLPLHLCDAAMIVSVIMLFTGNRFLYEIAYFWGLGASLQALFTPDIHPFSYPHFIFFNFFFSHGAIITAVLYMTLIEGFRPKAISILKMALFTNAYIVLIAAVNFITGGNYVFLCHKPSSASVMDLLGPWPWYIAGLEAVGLALSFILYLPWLLSDLFKRQKPTRSIGF